MIIGAGTDVVDIDRFRNLDDRAEYLAHVFTRGEIRDAPDGPSQDTFYATLFAIKEALMKALGCGLESVATWREIRITRDWRPRLSGSLRRLARERSVSRIHIAHSHSKKTVIAFVVVEATHREDIHEQHRVL
jgi:holo-[acyl-carrier protein] synthase